MNLGHTHILPQTPLDDAMHILDSLESDVGFHAMNPLVVWERLRQLRRSSDLSPGLGPRTEQDLANLIPKDFICEH